MQLSKRIHFLVLCLASLLALGACATSPDNAADEDPFDTRDPIKPVNQMVFGFNQGFDRFLLRPAAHTYHHVPDWGRTGVSNFLGNLHEPSNMVNGMLQLDPDIFFISFSRFVLNTTVGVLGFRDVATEDGLEFQDQGFDKTMNRYGIGEGFYTVIPVLGPSTVRGTVGQIADSFLDPVDFLLTTPESIVQSVVEGVSERDDNDDIIDRLYYKAIDPYAATRATFLQYNELK